MARYSVQIELAADGSCKAHVEDLVGCFATGPSVKEALANLREEIPRYLEWLEEHGERHEPLEGPLELKVVEEVCSKGPSASRPGADGADFFASDAEELTVEELQTAMRRMELSRRELLEFLEGAPPEILDWRPTPDAPSISSLLVHIAQAEAECLAHLEEQPPPYPLLRSVRGWVYHRLSRLSEEDRRRVTSQSDQRWSARRVIRRFLEQEWWHLSQIRGLVGRYRRPPGAA